LQVSWRIAPRRAWTTPRASDRSAARFRPSPRRPFVGQQRRPRWAAVIWRGRLPPAGEARMQRCLSPRSHHSMPLRKNPMTKHQIISQGSQLHLAAVADDAMQKSPRSSEAERGERQNEDHASCRSRRPKSCGIYGRLCRQWRPARPLTASSLSCPVSLPRPMCRMLQPMPRSRQVQPHGYSPRTETKGPTAS